MVKIPLGPKEVFVNGELVFHYESTGNTDQDIQGIRARLDELGLSIKHQPEWMQIRQQALYFQDTCTYLWRYEANRQKSERPFTMIPYIVNSAFCIELYLKALSLKHGKRQHGHELAKLYAALPASAVADVDASLAEALSIVPLGKSPEIAVLMQELNNAFLKWRYAFESERLGMVGLLELRFLRLLMFLACRNELPSPSAPTENNPPPATQGRD